MDMIMKIKWINPSHSFAPTQSNVRSDLDSQKIHINPGYYILRSYYKYKRLANYEKLIWSRAHFQPIFDSDIEDIINEKIDILCLSFFIWNFSTLIQLAKRFKESNPSGIIIAGGPQLDAHKRSDFFNEHPYIDYVVYGDGEDAFVSILDSIIEDTNSLESPTNIVTKNKKYPHRVFSDKAFWGFSPILDLREEIKSDVTELYELYPQLRIRMEWELDRGCPYSCSFCDWSSGLHHKVKRRSKFWKEELDFLTSLPAKVKLVNANFGIFEEDLQIAKYIAANKIYNVDVPYMAKMNKPRAWKIQEELASINPDYLVSIQQQDVDEEVLENIDRPGVPWESEKEYILDFKSKFPNAIYWFAAMIGLPGQTVDTMRYFIMEIDRLKIQRVQLECYHWHLLYNSPGYDLEYRKKHKLIFEEYFLPTSLMDNIFDHSVTKNDLVQLYERGSPLATKVELVRETYSANRLEIIKMIMITSIFSGIQKANIKKRFSDIIYDQKFIEYLNKKALEIEADIERTGLWGKWCHVTKKWYSIETYHHQEHFLVDFINKFG
jgi:hypothetical protein